MGNRFGKKRVPDCECTTCSTCRPCLQASGPTLEMSRGTVWIMEVNIERRTDDGGRVREWKPVHPTGGPRYEYATRHEADAMLRMCYPEQTRDEARTREVSA